MILDRGDLRRGVVDKPAVVAKVLDVGINSGQPNKIYIDRSGNGAANNF
jgi:hypothetical protein